MLRSQKKSGQLPAEMTTLQVGNHIAEARYNYSLIQERVFNHIIWYCQRYIEDIKAGKIVEQLELFKDMADDDTIRVPIKMNHIGRPDEYNHIRESCRNMREVTVMTKVTDKRGEPWNVWDGLINRVEEPTGTQRPNHIFAVISKPVAEMLIRLDRRKDGTPIRYTTFKYEICMSAKNKYSARIYKYLSRWKDQMHKYISVEDLREMLELGKKYKNTESLKRRILRPIQEELQQFGDLWYEVEDPEFEVKDGKRVVGYNIRIITVASSLHYVKQKENIVFMFKTEFGFKPGHLKKIQYIIDNQGSWHSMDWRLNIVKQELAKNRKRDIPAYVVTSLLNHFKDA